MSKLCPKGEKYGCGQILPYEDFGKNKGRHDGLSVYCKTCEAQRSRDKNRRRAELAEQNRLHLDPETSLKVCIRCEKEKLLKEFPKHPHFPDGYFYYCTPCNHELTKLRYLKNRADRLAQVRKGIAEGWTKECTCCKKDLPYSEYALKLAAKDGLDSRCNYCRNSRVRALKQQLFEITGLTEHQRDLTRNNPRVTAAKKAAREAVHRAVAAGVVVEPTQCECGCGYIGVLEAHHPDYNKPLEVIWLSGPCHGLWHHLFKAIEPIVT